MIDFQRNLQGETDPAKDILGVNVGSLPPVDAVRVGVLFGDESMSEEFCRKICVDVEVKCDVGNRRGLGNAANDHRCEISKILIWRQWSTHSLMEGSSYE
jgi:hypothetical protein